VANLQALMNNMIDGLLICHTLHTTNFDHLKSQLHRGIPIVQFYRVSDEIAIPKIYSDDESGAFQITEHLISKGSKKIGLLLGPKALSINKRLNGYLQALKQHGIESDDKLIKHVDFSYNAVIKAVDEWLEMEPAIDAIFSISDKCAVQIIRYLKSKKITFINYILRQLPEKHKLMTYLFLGLKCNYLIRLVGPFETTNASSCSEEQY
jgi:LacI family transcriptional regulator